jgi:hypothetical protein
MDYSKSEHANCLKIYGKLDIKWHATLAFTKKKIAKLIMIVYVQIT